MEQGFDMACRWRLKSGYEQLALENNFLRKLAVELDEKLILHKQLAMPLARVDLHRFLKILACDTFFEAI